MSDIIYPNKVGDLIELVGRPTLINESIYGCLAINKKENLFLLANRGTAPEENFAVDLIPGYYFQLVTKDHPTLGQDIDYVEEICTGIDWRYLSNDWEYLITDVLARHVNCNLCKHYSLLNLYCNFKNIRKDPKDGCYSGEI